MYLIRLDDASEYMDVEKWNQIEKIFDKYKIKPIVGVIPNNKDKKIINLYTKNELFWEMVILWQNKGWDIALHGYEHVYSTSSGGINPINLRSEFAAVNLNIQKKKISNGIKIFEKHGIKTSIFFAPSHTFDMNTLEALKSESDIRVISDTIANDIYKMNDFYFIPQQAGKVRFLPLKTVTFCYHPNTMTDSDFIELDSFIDKNINKFISFRELRLKDKQYSLFDVMLKKIYFFMKFIRNKKYK